VPPPDPRTEPAPVSQRPPGTLRIGTLAGADVLVARSWFVIAGLLALGLAEPIGRAQPGLGAWRFVAGLAFAVLLYLSVLLHEGAHAAMARHYGFPVRSITIHFLGGFTAIEGEARTARQEFLIAVVGPLASLAVALGAWLVSRVVPDGLLALAVTGLVGANFVVGLLNLIPGLPLDGGRVLKALVWGVSGNVHRGTVIAAWAGRVVAVAALAWPFFQERLLGSPASPVDYVIAFIVAGFMWSGASAALSSARLRRKLPRLVGRALARRTLSVPEDLPVSEAVRRAQDAQAGGIITVTGAGRPVGVVNESALLATPEDRRPWVSVAAVARTLDEGLSLPADIAGEELIVAISRRPADEYLLVEEDGSIFGVLATSDVDRAFRASR
jgi:Zn-dependent protease/CBS domain-containing protein